ncbi:MAG TPA: cytochrome c family protein [Alphaproteobacteria bacterium]|nr:cytochrome c family protein [Alphaproteobacteria bacterium]
MPLAAAGQDLAAGAAAYRKCQACHQLGEGAGHGYGPALNGIVGRRAGSLAGFAYSLVMSEAGRNWLVWTPEALSDFLANPRDYLPGNRMTFIGLPDETERQNVIAYLMAFSPDYVPGGTPPGRAPAAN